MSSIIYKSLRGAVLGMMMILACTSGAYSDSYDADPNDDIPPVTIELNYLIPSAVHEQVSTRCFVADFSFMSQAQTSPDAMLSQADLPVPTPSTMPALPAENSPTPLRT